MEKVFCTTHTTNATCIAVELLLGGVIIEKATQEAGILSKGYMARSTVGGNGLPRVAQGTDHLTHRRAIKLVWILWLGCNC